MRDLHDGIGAGRRSELGAALAFTLTFTLAVWALLGSPAPARAADGDPATDTVPRVVPYHGYLERHGVALDAAVALRFDLYDSRGLNVWREERSDGDDRSCSAADDCRVTVSGGAFTAWLGEYVSIDYLLGLGDAFELEVSVRDDDGTWLPLGAREPLNPVPYALWVASSDGLAVSGAVEVDGETAIGGTLEATGGVAVRASAAGGDGAGDLSTQRVTASGTVTAGGLETIILAADGATSDVEVGGDLDSGGGKLYVDGEIALSSDSGDVLGLGTATGASITVPDTTTATGDIDVTGAFDLTEGARGDHWTASSARPLMYTKYLYLGNSNDVGTGMSTADWICWIGGLVYFTGDICESSTSNCIDGAAGEYALTAAFAYPGSSEWHVYATFITDSNDEETGVQLVCAQKSAFDFYCPGSGSRGFYPADCSDYLLWIPISGGMHYDGWE